MGSEDGTEIGSSDDMSVVNVDGKLEGSLLGELLVSEVGTEVGSSDGIYGGNEDEKFEGRSLGYSL